MLGLDAVIDLSHNNGTVDFNKVAGAGIKAVILKATQGIAYIDQNYRYNKAKALEAGLLVGAYHFGTNADGATQADHFIDVAGNDVLQVLDFEQNQGSTITLLQGKAFIREIKAKTGKFPVVYTGGYIKDLLGPNFDADFASCKLWLAQYGQKAVIPVSWKNYTLWQYEQNGTIEGVTGYVDRSVFNGDADQLAQFWKTQ